ncbi:CLUMA_CG011061, isoform A [Clunio marinus]|uniref:CLUMA_CG011061, isoform A n=1 Tax=Clunio marinus TaxID=568069 RepID=A0A1J1IGX2_9DIPT|nr:CLUMA_CG011061, isoform A [Clunio marinus]
MLQVVPLLPVRKSNDMEYSEDFRIVQTTLNHCNEFVKKFDKIQYYGGNEVYVHEVAERLKNVFLSNSWYNVEFNNKLRKVTLLLMLNTDVQFPHNLTEDFRICHLLNNFAQLSKCLLIHLLWKLKLDTYFYESIKYSPSWFPLQFFDETADSLRFSKPYETIERVKCIVEAVYFNICRMDSRLRAHSASTQLVEQKTILNMFEDHVMTLLRNYNTPDLDESFKHSKLSKYMGHSLNCQLSLIHECFKLFQKKPFVISEEFHIFKLLEEMEPEINNFHQTYPAHINECLSNINVALLNTLQNSVLNVTLFDFMNWVEVDIEDNSKENEDLKLDNLQKSVGVLSYNLTQLINNNECFQHDVVKQLESIAIKPKTLKDVTSEATVGTVLSKIESSCDRRAWLEELLDRPDTLYCNSECLQTIIENIDIVQFKHLSGIIQDHQNYGEMDAEDENRIKEILFLGRQNLVGLELRDFTELMIRSFGIDYNLEMNESNADYSSKMMNYQNKLTDNNIDESTMWKLLAVNPTSFYQILFSDVTNQDSTQINILLNILSETNSVAVDYVKNLVKMNLESLSSDSSSKSLYHMFLLGLYKLNLFDRKEFIRDVIMNNLAQAMTNDHLNVVLILLKTLNQIATRMKVEELMSPLIILLAQILDKYRWDLLSFTQQKEVIVETSIAVIQDFMKTLLVHGSMKDKTWISSKITNNKATTKFYFQKLSLEKNASIIPFENFIHPEGFEKMAKSKVTTFLCETIVRCTSKEFKWLMTNQLLQSFIIDALIVVSVIVAKSKNRDSSNCLHKCISNYIKVSKNLIIPTLEGKDQRESYFSDIIKLIRKFPEESFEDLTILFIDFLKLFNDIENFRSSLDQIRDCEMKRIILEE